MSDIVDYYPTINLEKLNQLPGDTFDKEYARHLKANNLKPLGITPKMQEMEKQNLFALRYILTHDIFHVFLGFDTSYAGEVRVLAFSAEQNYSQSLKISLWTARLIYQILALTQLREIFTNIRKGKEMAKKAKFLLGYGFEENWERPLAEVKTELGLV